MMKPLREFSSSLPAFLETLEDPNVKAQVYAETLKGLSYQEQIMLKMIISNQQRQKQAA